MKNYFLGAGAVVLAVLLFFAGQLTGQKTTINSLGGYNSSTQFSSGFTSSFTTSTVISAATFCGPTNTQWTAIINVSATATLPAATTTYAACNNPQLGAVVAGQVTNDSTNTVTYVAGTGQNFKCETQGVGTSTVVGGCTSSTFAVPSSTTVLFSSYFDTASSVQKITVGNAYQ